ncbi:hypothetical protein, partial [Stenotrophomonas sp. HMWF023]|uniref:hypothetical protein n=1 Tax=Stenotrophomonas sp. HMWF023 TaxID=2056859 RepID=UPI002159C93F
HHHPRGAWLVHEPLDKVKTVAVLFVRHVVVHDYGVEAKTSSQIHEWTWSGRLAGDCPSVDRGDERAYANTHRLMIICNKDARALRDG